MSESHDHGLSRLVVTPGQGEAHEGDYEADAQDEAGVFAPLLDP